MIAIGAAECAMIVGQHVALRATIGSVQTSARAALAGTRGEATLAEAVAKLRDELLHHLATEERLLAPVLAQQGSRGMLHASLMQAEHAHERAVLMMLIGDAARPSAEAVAKHALELCDHLLADMEYEEREMLRDQAPQTLQR